MKKCVVISDSFKGTLSSLEICEIARESIHSIFPGCEPVTIPVADGGEGTVDCFVEALQAKRITIPIHGPYGKMTQASYARSGVKAVIEMAGAAGLPMVGSQPNPAQTSTFGVGEIIRHAVENGCREILLGLGGSATNDGGCGCAAALGVRFQNGDGLCFVPRGRSLSEICSIDLGDARRLLDGVKITVMCDVENPLYGPNGAAYIFGPQKGADEQMTRLLDQQLQCLDRTIQRELGLSVANIPGTGAAGGMGAGCVAFLGAELKSGIEAVLDMVDFDRKLEGASMVITGEGRIDSQSVHGKVISGIAKRTRAKNIPLIAIVGSIADSAAEAYELGVTAMFSIDRQAVAFEEYAGRCRQDYKHTLEDILRLVRAMAYPAPETAGGPKNADQGAALKAVSGTSVNWGAV